MEYKKKHQVKKIFTHEFYKIKAIKLPSNLNLAGERVPIEKKDIRERMDRELLVNTYWQSNGLLLIKRANKYFPILEPLLKKHGLPDDFKFLALAESAFTDETSSAGAAGIWHFMKRTGKEYGLEINKNVDERYHIEKSTKVAAAYLKKSKERFNSWTLAAAAYNAGNYGIHKQLEKQQVTNYYDALLANETERYIFRIIALKEVISNPKMPLKSMSKPATITRMPRLAKSLQTVTISSSKNWASSMPTTSTSLANKEMLEEVGTGVERISLAL